HDYDILDELDRGSTCHLYVLTTSLRIAMPSPCTVRNSLRFSCLLSFAISTFPVKIVISVRSLCFVLEILNNVTPPDTYSVQGPSGGVTQKKDGIFINQDKYVDEILKKFGFTEVKTASILMETQKPMLKDEDGEEVDVYMYRSMIGSLMYLTTSRPGIMFAVCACARYQVNPKVMAISVILVSSDSFEDSVGTPTG
ncbi:hypothetical protein Tco_1348952, partial [Tanacetum coccineum]